MGSRLAALAVLMLSAAPAFAGPCVERIYLEAPARLESYGVDELIVTTAGETPEAVIAQSEEDLAVALDERDTSSRAVREIELGLGDRRAVEADGAVFARWQAEMERFEIAGADALFALESIAAMNCLIAQR